jgi:hypothetical protein
MVLVGFVIGAAYELEGEKLSEHRWLMPWIAGAFVGLASYLNNKISKPTRDLLDELDNNWDEQSHRKTVEDRLDILERLKRREMVTPEEYTAKRQEILKDL